MISTRGELHKRPQASEGCYEPFDPLRLRANAQAAETGPRPAEVVIMGPVGRQGPLSRQVAVTANWRQREERR